MRAGQFIQCGIRGFEREESLRHISRLLPASISLFRGDYRDEEDLQALIRQINRIYKVDNATPEPYIAIDQEGGNVVRLPWLNYSPGNYLLGRLDNTNLTKFAGMLAGYDLYSRGIRWNLAPVLDVLNSYNPVLLERSFGEDIDLIARHGEAYIRGLQSYGVGGTAKHFPGHGGVLEDSHLELPKDRRPLSSIMNDAYPFRKAIEAGVKSVMMSHVLYESLDPDFPASLSPKIYDMARNEFGFRGLIVTDSVDMLAIKDNFSPQEIVKYSLGNGADLLECADLGTSLELSVHVLSVDSEKLKRKVEHIAGFPPKPTLSFRPPEVIMTSLSVLSNEFIRGVPLDPSEPVKIFFLDTNPDSNVAEPFSSFEFIMKQLGDLHMDIDIGNSKDFEGFNGKEQQMILVGRNEHMKDRIRDIREKTAENSAVYISTSISKDTGTVPDTIGYIAAFSTKGYSILGAIYKAMGLM